MIFSNSTVWTNYRMKVTGPCDMNLKRFDYVMLLKSIELPDFVLINFSVIAIEQIYPAGWWDELTVAFVFKRRYGWYILQVICLGYPISRMMFIFLSLLELAVVGFMSRNEGGGIVLGSQLDSRGRRNITSNNITEISAWKDMPSPKIDNLFQFWVDKHYSSLQKCKGSNEASLINKKEDNMLDYGGAPTSFMIPSFQAPNHLLDSQMSSVEKTSTGSFSGAPLFNLRMTSQTYSREGHKQNKFLKNEEGPSCCIKRLWHRVRQITPEQVDKYRYWGYYLSGIIDLVLRTYIQLFSELSSVEEVTIT
uniref:Uncharacterized protein n=1 Tax=Meloidogyne floridensis TaxID=298350 RepID=A0A915NSR1_9BILA